MEIRELKYFLAVAREQNLSHAAETLFTTQPNLTRQMQKLEKEIGQPLFVRGRKITLTEAGQLLYRLRRGYAFHKQDSHIGLGFASNAVLHQFELG